MILYYFTKFYFIIINSFRPIGHGHSPTTLKKPRPNKIFKNTLKVFFLLPEQ